MSKGYEQYMPKKETTVLVQAKVREEVYNKVKEEKDKNEWTWDEFINGLCEKYLDDKKLRKGELK